MGQPPARCRFCGGEMAYVKGEIRWGKGKDGRSELKGHELYRCGSCFAEWIRGAQGSTWKTSLVSSVWHDP